MKTAVLGAIIEFIIFSVPSWVYAHRLSRRTENWRAAWAAVGVRTGKPRGYLLAAAAILVLFPLAYFATRAVPSSVLHSPHVVISNSTSPSGLVDTILLAFAEEMLFRGFVATLLIRRYGFWAGNTAQAFVFLAPHLLLLVVSSALWPLVIVQLAAGWILGWIRCESGSVFPGAAAHAIANIAAGLLLAA